MMADAINNQIQDESIDSSKQDDLDFELIIEDITDEEFQELRRQAETKPYQIYNSLSKRANNPVNEIVGWDAVINLIYSILDEHTKPDEYPMTRFQVSTMWLSTKDKPKPDEGKTPCNARGWGERYPKPDYEGIGWVTVETTKNVKTEMRKAGLAVRGGVKEGGNDLKHWVGAQCIYFDLDEGELLTIEQTLEKCQEYFIQPCEISYSPSGDPDNLKLRLGIDLDEFCTDYDRLDSIAKRICQVLPNAANIHDPARFYYGTIRPDEMYVDYQAVNNLDYLEEQLPEYIEETKAEQGKKKIENNLTNRIN